MGALINLLQGGYLLYQPHFEQSYFSFWYKHVRTDDSFMHSSLCSPFLPKDKQSWFPIVRIAVVDLCLISTDVALLSVSYSFVNEQTKLVENFAHWQLVVDDG